MLLQRIVWLSVVFSGVCGTAFHSYTMANRYFQYNVQTVVYTDGSGHS
jgi:hypothetical protein